MKKKNVLDYAPYILSTGALLGIVIPVLVFVFTGVTLWPCICTGMVILAWFMVLLFIELNNDRVQRKIRRPYVNIYCEYDPLTQVAVLRNSLHSDGRVAGFKDKASGVFTEVMTIDTDEDIEIFKEIYGIIELKKEY